MTSDNRHPFVLYGGGKSARQIHDYGFKMPRPNFLIYEENVARYCTVSHDDGRTEHQLYYEVHGRGDIKVIMIMGLAAPHTEWEDQLGAFDLDRFTVCVFDNRGIGFSDTPGGRWTTRIMALDVHMILNELARVNGERWDTHVHVLGASMGGMIALETVLEQPSRFASVTLISTHAGGIRGTIPPIRGLWPFLKTFLCSRNEVDIINSALEIKFPRPLLERDLQREDHARASDCGNYFPAYKIDKHWDQLSTRNRLGMSILRRMRKIGERVGKLEFNIAGLVRQVGSVLTHYVSWDRLRKLRNSKLPVLLIAGELDNLVHPNNSRLLSKALKGDLLLFSDAGHVVNEQHKDQVNTAILQHLAASDAKDGQILSVQSIPPGKNPYVLSALVLAICCMLARYKVLKRRIVAPISIVVLIYISKRYS